MAVGFGSSSSINGSYDMLGCESLSLSCISSIKDGGSLSLSLSLRLCRVASEEESIARSCLYDQESMSEMSSYIHRSPSGVFNLSHYCWVLI